MIIAIAGIWQRRRLRHSGCRWVYPALYYHYYTYYMHLPIYTYVCKRRLYIDTYTCIIYYNFEKKLSDLFCKGPLYRESDNGVSAAVLSVSALCYTFITCFSCKIRTWKLFFILLNFYVLF